MAEKITFGRVQAVREDLADFEEKYLRANGWSYTSNHPDSVWRWSKTIGDYNYTMCRAAAVDLQIRIDQNAQL